uniref:Uncharacterized protein n=1 Tax=Clastoptera arizonana TaxID=38151 RepID=A0A1B6EDX7_9HEMI
MIYKCLVFLALVVIVSANKNKTSVQDKNLLITKLAEYIEMSCQQLNKSAANMINFLLEDKTDVKTYKKYRSKFIEYRDILDAYFSAFKHYDFDENDPEFVIIRDTITDLDKVEKLGEGTKEKALTDLNQSIKSVKILYEFFAAKDKT